VGRGRGTGEALGVQEAAAEFRFKFGLPGVYDPTYLTCIQSDCPSSRRGKSEVTVISLECRHDIQYCTVQYSTACTVVVQYRIVATLSCSRVGDPSRRRWQGRGRVVQIQDSDVLSIEAKHKLSSEEKGGSWAAQSESWFQGQYSTVQYSRLEYSTVSDDCFSSCAAGLSAPAVAHCTIH